MKTFSIVSALALALLALTFNAPAPLLASEAITPASNEPVMKPSDDPSWKLDFTDAEKIAVQEGRRKKPLQTFAFETVEQIVGRPLMGATFYKDQSNGAKLNAMDLYLSIWFFPPYWYDKPLILVSNNELRKILTPPPSVVSADAAAYAGMGKEQYFDEKRLSIKDLMRSPLKDMLLAMKEKPEDKLTAIEKDAKLVSMRIQLVNKIASSADELAMVPHPSDVQGTWDSMSKLFYDTRNADGENAKTKLAYNYEASKKACDAFIAFRDTYKTRDVAGFSLASKNLKESLQALSPEIYPTDTKMSVEVQYNNERPFAKAWIFYLFAALTALLALGTKLKPVYWGAMAFYLAGLALHIYGFAMRCYIAGRPPVSNMYESVIWVGFGAVFFGLIFELIYRKRYYMLAGATAGFLCLVLMDLVPVLMGNNEAQGFTSGIEPLQPVLRDNFWLTVHVLTITLSYAAFMLAWGMGHISLFSHLTRPDERAEHRELHTLVYRVMQIGVLLLSIGTILGGVWAYYSWGRFWGWDPKETWAFIALMCYIVVLHGRFAGLWTNFGLAFGSVLCFQAIVMAWYGVNFVLGSGKHAYGSGTGGLGIVTTCVAADMIFLAAATARYMMLKNVNRKVGDDEGEDQSARGRVEEKPENPSSNARDPHIKFS
jgi:ABC-type transport system involved in cytochrome c biogenesis permease subunit